MLKDGFWRDSERRRRCAILDQLRALLAAEPFRPFRLVVGNGDGRTFRIEGPADISFSRSGQWIQVHDGDVFNDEAVRIADIVAIEPAGKGGD